MNYKERTTLNTHQKHPLKFSQLIYRAVAFLGIFSFFWFILMKFSAFNEEQLFLSEIQISTTWVVSLLLMVLLFFFYLVVFAKDNTPKRLWSVFKLRGFLGGTPETGVKWWTFLIIFVFGIYFSHPNLYSNINAVHHTKIFKGQSIILQEAQTYKKPGKAYVNIIIENKKIKFYGNRKEFQSYINETKSIVVYQGIFTKYALIER